MKDLAVCKGYIVKAPELDQILIFEKRDHAMQWINWYLSSSHETEPVSPSYTIDIPKKHEITSDGISKCCGVKVTIETEEGFDGQVTPHHRCSKCKKELFPPSK